MDWIVTVKTQHHQIKEVLITDYVNPSDAVDAAMAQTNATNFISWRPYFPPDEPTQSSPKHISNSSSFTYIEPLFTETELTLKEHLSVLAGILLLPIAFIASPLLFVVLPMIIFPIIKYIIRGIRNEFL